jgi:hypothetical protein
MCVCNVYAYVGDLPRRSREQTRHERRTTTTTVSLLLLGRLAAGSFDAATSSLIPQA